MLMTHHQKRSYQRSHQRASGFGLVEIMVSLVIGMFGIIINSM